MKAFYRFLAFLLPLLFITVACNSESGDDSLSALLLASGGSSDSDPGNSGGGESGPTGQVKIVNGDGSGAQTVTIYSDASCSIQVTSANIPALGSSSYVDVTVGTRYSKYGSSPCSPGFTIAENKKYVLIDSHYVGTDGKILFAEVTGATVCAGQAAIRFAHDGKVSSSVDHRLYSDGLCASQVGATTSLDELEISSYICYSAASYYHHDDPPCAGPDTFAADRSYTIVSAGTDSIMVVEE